MTCHFRKTTDIIVPDIESVRKYSKKLRYSNFVNDKWSERDIEMMIRGYARVKAGKMTVAEAANEIGKTRSSFRNKAQRMGISSK
jgi:ABC-type glycerol-3-phosphate transport system substrate-binding protein